MDDLTRLVHEHSGKIGSFGAGIATGIISELTKEPIDLDSHDLRPLAMATGVGMAYLSNASSIDYAVNPGVALLGEYIGRYIGKGVNTIWDAYRSIKPTLSKDTEVRIPKVAESAFSQLPPNPAPSPHLHKERTQYALEKGEQSIISNLNTGNVPTVTMWYDTEKGTILGFGPQRPHDVGSYNGSYDGVSVLCSNSGFRPAVWEDEKRFNLSEIPDDHRGLRIALEAIQDFNSRNQK